MNPIQFFTNKIVPFRNQKAKLALNVDQKPDQGFAKEQRESRERLRRFVDDRQVKRIQYGSQL